MRAAAIWVRVRQRESVYRPPAGPRFAALTTRRPAVEPSPAAPAFSSLTPRTLQLDTSGIA